MSSLEPLDLTPKQLTDSEKQIILDAERNEQ